VDKLIFICKKTGSRKAAQMRRREEFVNPLEASYGFGFNLAPSSSNLNMPKYLYMYIDTVLYLL